MCGIGFSRGSSASVSWPGLSARAQSVRATPAPTPAPSFIASRLLTSGAMFGSPRVGVSSVGVENQSVRQCTRERPRGGCGGDRTLKLTPGGDAGPEWHVTGFWPAFPVVHQEDSDVFFESRCAGGPLGGIVVCAAAGDHVNAAEEFEVSPSRIELSSRLDQVQFLVTQKTASGTPRDVTRAVRFEIEGDRVVAIDEMGRVRAKAAGRTMVRVQFEGGVRQISGFRCQRVCRSQFPGFLDQCCPY
ncbi:MAG: hypothetical protein Ct9H300mP1_33860 [Planctomycetaceae bacterium]|nr:MAG: hypothetical protein Ct9H300mP1_33860 [Planctomycetaceae bacterium]